MLGSGRYRSRFCYQLSLDLPMILSHCELTTAETSVVSYFAVLLCGLCAFA